jgi:hypothetical protein
VELTPAEEQAIIENRMQNVLAFLAYGRGLRELDRGNYEAAAAEFETAASLEPGSFASLELAMAETAALTDASTMATVDLAGIASATGETGAGLFAPPSATTVQGLTSIGISDPSPLGAGSTTDGGTTQVTSALGTLTNVAEGVDPTPTAGTLGLGSAQQTQNPTPSQSQPTDREPVQEVTGVETPLASDATIRIVITRPGGDQ